MKIWIILFFLSPAISFSQRHSLNSATVGTKLPKALFQVLPRKVTTKLFILDFWSTTCSVCFDDFPKLNKLQRQFSDCLQIVLVNNWETESQIEDRMRKINSNKISMGLDSIKLPDLPSIAGNLNFKNVFSISSVPHHVWIDSNGVVQTITFGYNATSENVKAVLDGKRITMLGKDDRLLVDLTDNGIFKKLGTSLPTATYSAFLPVIGMNSGESFQEDSISGLYRVSKFNFSVIDLYMSAFQDQDFGKRVCVEVVQKELSKVPTDGNLIDNWKRKYFYSYEIQGNLKDIEGWKMKMQLDLNYFFWEKFSIRGAIEYRKINCFILTKVSDVMPKSSRRDRLFYFDDSILRAFNCPFIEVVNSLISGFERLDSFRPLLDETGISPNLEVDMTFKVNLADLKTLREQLVVYGLDIVEEERLMKVLVISNKG